MKRRKRLASLVLALVMAMSLFGCAAQKKDGGNGTAEQSSSENTLFDSSVELDIVVGSFVSWPYNEDWKMWQYFREAVGGKLNVTSIPTTDFSTKLSLMMASPEQLPDLMHLTSKDMVDSHATSGAYLSVDDHLDMLPNYQKFWDSIPEPERSNSLEMRLSGDGKCYFPATYGADRNESNYVWMYRKDIFEKHNLAVPETMEELFDVCVKLKELYPESYPFTMYNFNMLATIGPEWSPYFQHYVYYDFDKGEWRYGACEDTMREMIEYLIRCVDAKILAPDFMTMTTKAWEELVNTDRGFIMPAFVGRINTLNQDNRKENPDYTWSAMIPPKAGENGQNKIAHKAPGYTGYVVINTGKEERIANAFKLVDWMYTDEACELLSWGKEGETYEVKDGKKQYIQGQANVTPREEYGVLTSGLFQRFDLEASRQMMSEEENAAIELNQTYMEEKVNPKIWMAFSEEELKAREEVRTQLEAHTDEMLSKFILKQRPLSEWDQFVQELEDLGLAQMLDVHRSAYERVGNSMK